ncbi:MAG: hypothetical protein IPL70_02995 [Uliginosibacterium sp.]|nr:hypothetical protein [Uliginosibacterium sp.]
MRQNALCQRTGSGHMALSPKDSSLGIHARRRLTAARRLAFAPPSVRLDMGSPVGYGWCLNYRCFSDRMSSTHCSEILNNGSAGTFFGIADFSCGR